MYDDEEVDETTVAALAVRTIPDALVRPAAGLEDIAQAFDDYQSLTKSLLDDSDYQAIADRKFPKRSAWRKLAVAFGVSFNIVERTHDRGPDGRIQRSEFIVRALAPNGRYADGWGACSAFERCCPRDCRRRHQHCPSAQGEPCEGTLHFTHAEHDIPATAETRAKNRAAADLFGMGAVSAEEVVDSEPRARSSSNGGGPGKATPSMVRAIHTLIGKAAPVMGKDPKALETEIKDSVGVESFNDLAFEVGSNIIERLQLTLKQAEENTSAPSAAESAIAEPGAAGSVGEGNGAETSEAGEGSTETVAYGEGAPTSGEPEPATDEQVDRFKRYTKAKSKAAAVAAIEQHFGRPIAEVTKDELGAWFSDLMKGA